MNLFMQFTGISSWYNMYRLQQAMKSGVITRAGSKDSGAENPGMAVNGQRELNKITRGPYSHPYLGNNIDMMI